jgi:uncharacterized protein
MIMAGDVTAIKEFYRKTSEKLGFNLFPSETSINQAGYTQLRNNRPEKAIELLKYNTTLYPESANVYDSLAEAYMNSGNKNPAIENYEKAVKLDSTKKSAIDNLKKLKNN